MFEQLQARLGEILNRLRGRGMLSLEDVDLALREIRRALLEADVSLAVVREFIARVREAAVGQEIWKSLTPGQQVAQIVLAELTRMLGSTHHPLRVRPPDHCPPGRAARHREDDNGGEAGAVLQETGAESTPGGGRPLTPRRRPAAGGHRKSRGCAGGDARRGGRPRGRGPAGPRTQPRGRRRCPDY